MSDLYNALLKQQELFILVGLELQNLKRELDMEPMEDES